MDKTTWRKRVVRLLWMFDKQHAFLHTKIFNAKVGIVIMRYRSFYNNFVRFRYFVFLYQYLAHYRDAILLSRVPLLYSAKRFSSILKFYKNITDYHLLLRQHFWYNSTNMNTSYVCKEFLGTKIIYDQPTSVNRSE